MRNNIVCQIDIIKILNNVLKEMNIDTDDFNFDSIPNNPICSNGQPIGIIMDDDNACLWLDIKPEFVNINDKWNLSALSIDFSNRNKNVANAKCISDMDVVPYAWMSVE